MPETTQPRAQMSADDRRRLLMDAAMRVMKREGIAAATTRAICQEAEMPHGAFHYCFRSKRELFASLFEKDFTVPLDTAWEQIGAATDPETALRSLFGAYWAGLEGDPAHQLVLSELTNYALRDADLRGLPNWEYEAYRGTIAEHLTTFAERLDVEFTVPAPELADMILAALSGVTSAWLAHGSAEAARASLDRFAGLFASCIRPRRQG